MIGLLGSFNLKKKQRAIDRTSIYGAEIGLRSTVKKEN